MSDRATQEKVRIRDAARAARQTLDDGTRESAATDAARRIWQLKEFADARLVAAYIANDEEIDPSPAVEQLRAVGIAIAMPRVEDPEGLAMHLVEADTALMAGAFGVLEPAPDTPVAELEDIDAIVVPGVAFDVAGHRIGYGGGFYDRLLPQLRSDALRVGLAFDLQIVERIPALPHDATVDILVTPTRSICTAATRG